jgi:hypothetical protein
VVTDAHTKRRGIRQGVRIFVFGIEIACGTNLGVGDAGAGEQCTLELLIIQVGFIDPLLCFRVVWVF